MRSAGRKDIYREIRHTFGRFLSLLVIVALGVSFFAGLGATGLDMKLTGDAYFDRFRLMDVRVVSTYGLDKKDIRALTQMPGVKNVFPAYTIDAVAEYGSQSYTLKVHSLEAVNRPVLISGRMPEHNQDALVEPGFLTTHNLSLGDTFTIKSGKKNDIRQQLRTNTFRAVGTVRAPYYVSKERGSSSIGDGTVNNFLYIPAENFLRDVYSEAFLQIESAEKLLCFEDSYKDKLDDMVDKIEAVGDVQVVRRFEDMTAGAYKELDRARESLNARRMQVTLELDEAQDILNQNHIRIQTALLDMPIRQAQLDESLHALSLQEAQVSAALRTVEDAEMQLDLQENQAKFTQRDLYEQSYALDEQRPESKEERIVIAQARAQITAGLTEIAAGLSEIAAGRQNLYDQKRLLRQSIFQLQAAREEIAQIDTVTPQAELSRMRAALDASAALWMIDQARAKTELDQAEANIERARAALDDLKTPKWYVLDRESNPGYASYSQDADKITAIGRVFPLIFFLVAALVSLTTMTRLVEERRGEIGTLKSLGYGNFSIISKYIVYAAVPTLIGGAIGGWAGMKAFPRIILQAYGMLYSVPEALTPLNFSYWLMGGGLALVCTVTATVLSCLHELRETPARLMRPKPPKTGRRTLLENMQFFWKRLTFTQKVTIRNIIRYKKRFYMTVIGIAGCTALLLTGFGVRDSVAAIMGLQYEEICRFQMSVSFQDSAKPKDVNQVDLMLRSDALNPDTLPFYQKSMDAVKTEHAAQAGSAGASQSANLIVTQDDASLRRFIVLRDRVSQEPISISDHGVVITEKLAALLRLRPGDQISFKSGDDPYISAEVTGICENYLFHYIYMPASLYASFFKELGPLEYNGIYARFNQNNEGDYKALANQVLEERGVSSVTFTENSVLNFQDVVNSLNFVVLVLIVSAAALALVVLLNLSSISISERMRELATIEVLGFYDLEVSAYVFRESAILTVIGAFIGLGLGVALHLYILLSAETDIMMFGRAIRPLSFLFSLALTFVFALCANLVSSGKLRAIHMVEALKSVE